MKSHQQKNGRGQLFSIEKLQVHIWSLKNTTQTIKTHA